MKRSAIVWDYSGQMRLVEERYAAYMDHQAESHTDDVAEEPAEDAPHPLDPSREGFRVPRSVLTNIGIGLAVLVVVVVLLFLHVA
jgi:hypothetical protein